MTSDKLPTLLLVDDEPDLLLSLQGLLRQEFQLFVADSGPAALAVIESETIQVVMTDQRMPEISGDELLARIARLSPYTVRILLTGYADIQDVIRALNSGGLFRYLTKPWDLDELMDVVRQAAAQYRQTAEQQERRRQTAQFHTDVIAFLRSLPESNSADELIRRGQELWESNSEPR